MAGAIRRKGLHKRLFTWSDQNHTATTVHTRFPSGSGSIALPGSPTSPTQQERNRFDVERNECEPLFIYGLLAPEPDTRGSPCENSSTENFGACVVARPKSCENDEE